MCSSMLLMFEEPLEKTKDVITCFTHNDQFTNPIAYPRIDSIAFD